MLYQTIGSSRVSAGLLLLRFIIGLAFIFHGWTKIQHPMSWMGQYAFAPPWLQAIVAIVEFGGGIALILGLLTPLVAVAIFVDMAVAILKVHIPSGGQFVGGRMSFEIPLFYLVSMVVLLLTGPGQYSLDALLVRKGTPTAGVP